MREYFILQPSNKYKFELYGKYLYYFVPKPSQHLLDLTFRVISAINGTHTQPSENCTNVKTNNL